MSDYYQLTPLQIVDLVERIPLEATSSIEVCRRRYRQFERSVFPPRIVPREREIRVAGIAIEPNDAIPPDLLICLGHGRVIVGVIHLPEIDDAR